MAGVKNVVFLLITLMLMTLVTHVCIADTSSGQLLINNNNNKLIDNNRERESRETRDAQSWYSALTLFCCMTVYQIVTERIARHTQKNFSLYFLIFKPSWGSWLPRVKKYRKNNTSSGCRKPKLQGQVTNYKLNFALNDYRNRCVFKCFLKADKDCADVTTRGKPFQTRTD